MLYEIVTKCEKVQASPATQLFLKMGEKQQVCRPQENLKQNDVKESMQYHLPARLASKCARGAS